MARQADYWEQGLKAYKAQNYRGAIEAWLKELERGEASGHFKGKGAVAKVNLLRFIGGSYFQLGLNGQALAIFRQALALAEQLGDRSAQVDLNVDIGRSYEYLGRYEKSLASLTTAKQLVAQIGDHPSKGLILNGLGQVHSNLAHYEQALASYQQALQFARSKGIQWLEGSVQLHIGMLHLNRGVFDKAIGHLHNAYDIAHNLEDTRGQSATNNSLGNFYYSLGQHGEALKYHHQSLAIKKRLQDKYGQGIAHFNIGNTYKSMGRRQEAIQSYGTSLKICREIHDKYGEAQALNSLGAVLLATKAYHSALPRFRNSLTIGEEIKSPQIQCLSTMNIGASLHGMGKADEAYRFLGQSLEICTRTDSPEELWKVHRGLGTIEEEKQKFDKAIVNYRKAIRFVETMREGVSGSHGRISFMQDKMMVYDQLVELYRQLHHKFPSRGFDKKALEIFERKQGRAFLEDMGRSGARHFAGLPDDVRRKETSLPLELKNAKTRLKSALSKPRKEQDTELIEQLENNMASLEAKINKLKAEIREKYADYYALKYPQPASVEHLQQRVLNPDEMMLIYGVMEHKTCLWVIGKDHFSLHTIDAGEADLQDKIQVFMDEIHKVERAIVKKSPLYRIRRVIKTSLRKVEPAGRHLYNLLLPQSARGIIKDEQTLCVVPTGPLYSLPFEALTPPKAASNSKANYLIQDHAVVYLSSASLLKTLRDAQSRRNTPPKYPLLAFAHPVYENAGSAVNAGKGMSVKDLRTRAYQKLMGGHFSELPETETEVKWYTNDQF